MNTNPSSSTLLPQSKAIRRVILAVVLVEAMILIPVIYHLIRT